MTSSKVPYIRPWSKLIAAGFLGIVASFAAVLIRWPDNFFADDSYFYFQVAWNIARGLGSTFNNVVSTNGYHPLWMLACVAVFKLLPSKVAAVHGIAVVIAVLDLGTLLLLSLLTRFVAPGFWWIAWFLFTPFCFLTQLGTEGALSGFFLAILVLSAYLLTSEPTGLKAFCFALCGALAVLSRLDNIFVVGLVSIAVFVAAPLATQVRVRKLMMFCLPVYLVIWGAYVGSNLHWFGTIQPISGLLKAHSHDSARRVVTLPHIPLIGLAIIVPAILILARIRRDLFFRVVELPFAAGVLMHAAYIWFVMSSETRWSWYYTSWILLACILLARISHTLLGKVDARIHNTLATASLLTLFLIWYNIDYRRSAHFEPEAVGAGYQENLSDRLHMHTVLAFDKPGRIAYYTGVQIVALDGLMGNLQFQHDLATKGIAAFDAQHHVDGFIGPPEPLDPVAQAIYCDHLYLSSIKLHCSQSPSGDWRVTSAEVFARLYGVSAGTIDLPQENLVWNFPQQVAVWRLP